MASGFGTTVSGQPLFQDDRFKGWAGADRTFVHDLVDTSRMLGRSRASKGAAIRETQPKSTPCWQRRFTCCPEWGSHHNIIRTLEVFYTKPAPTPEWVRPAATSIPVPGSGSVPRAIRYRERRNSWRLRKFFRRDLPLPIGGKQVGQQGDDRQQRKRRF